MKKITTPLKKNGLLLLVILLSSIFVPIQAQINAGPDQTICFPNCANLSATITPQSGTSSYTVSNIAYAPDPFNAGTLVSLSDDEWSAVINIGFTFCFYGNSYTQLLIGSNNMLSFDLAGAGGNCPWPINAAVPTPSNPMNTVMGPWEDINPGLGGTIKYTTYGVAPNRRFVVSYLSVPMFSCTGLLYSNQIVLKETSNIVETYIQDKHLCPTWNGGNAIHALHNSNGTLAAVDGIRNWPNQWSAFNEATRWTPSGASAYTVAWLDPSNNVIGNTANVTVCPNTTTTYTAVVTYLCPVQVFTDQVVVNVVNPPIPTISANGPLSFCQGGSVILTSSSATGNVWSTGATTQSITVSVSGSYTVTVTDVNGCVTTSAATIVTVFPNPTVTIASVNVLCNGANDGTATANPSNGTAPYTYLWNNGQTTQTILGLAPGTYNVTVTDANGCVGTASVTISQPANGQVVTYTQVDVLCFGNATGTATANPSGGTPGYTYLWSDGQTTQTAVGLVAGTYNCTVTDANGCFVSIVVTIVQPTVLNATGTKVDVLCFGNATGTATANPSGGTPSYTYLWSDGQTTQAAIGLVAGNYTCTVTDANGCNVNFNIIISEPAAALTLTTSQTNILCNGQATGDATVNPMGGTSPYSYLWNNGGTTSTISGLIAGTYTVTVTDANGCISNASVTLTQPLNVISATSTQVDVLCFGNTSGSATVNVVGGTPGYTYLWSDGQTAPTATNLLAGTYACVITDANGCTVTVNVTINEPALLAILLINPVTICIGQNTTLISTATGGTPPYAFVWSPSGPLVNPVITTVYSVTATDANGCTSAPQTVTVTVNPPLAMTVTKSDSICPGQTIAITASASGGDGGPYNYQWTWAGGTSTFASINVTPAVTTTYYVTATDNCGTPSVSDSVTITVNPVALIVMNVDKSNGCSPLCVNFTDASTIATGSIASWTWDFGDGSAMSTSQNPSHCYDFPGSYNVTLTTTSNLGCISSSTINSMITVYADPIPQFTFGPQPTTVLDPLISFSNLSTNATSYLWDFGDKNDDAISTLANPQHTYSDTGIYCVKLVAESQYGCKDSVTNCLVIDPQFTLFIPNAFSPNGDGENDVFAPKGQFILEFEMIIYDRWGNLIFRTNNINYGWNGAANNGDKVAQQDVYVYLIKVLDLKGNKRTFNGPLTIVK